MATKDNFAVILAMSDILTKEMEVQELRTTLETHAPKLTKKDRKVWEESLEADNILPNESPTSYNNYNAAFCKSVEEAFQRLTSTAFSEPSLSTK